MKYMMVTEETRDEMRLMLTYIYVFFFISAGIYAMVSVYIMHVSNSGTYFLFYCMGLET